MLLLLSLLAGTALSDPPAPPPDPPLPAPVSSGDRRQGPFSRDTYPSELSARPLTLPAGMFRAGAGLSAFYFQQATTTSWLVEPGLSVAFGLTDHVELGASTAFTLSPALDAPRVRAFGIVLFMDEVALDLALQAGLSVAPFSRVSPPAIILGVPGRLLLDERLFLTFGEELLRVRILTSYIVLPFFLEVALRLGLGAQVTGGVAITAETDLFQIVNQSVAARRPSLPLGLAASVAVVRGLDLRVSAQLQDLFNPGLSGTLALAGSAYF